MLAPRLSTTERKHEGQRGIASTGPPLTDCRGPQPRLGPGRSWRRSTAAHGSRFRIASRVASIAGTALVVVRSGRRTVVRLGWLRYAGVDGLGRARETCPVDRPPHQRHELSNTDPGFEFVSQVRVVGDVIAVASSVLVLEDVALVDEFADDLLHCPFRDSDHVGDVAHPSVRMCGQRDEHMPIVREKRPATYTHTKHDT